MSLKLQPEQHPDERVRQAIQKQLVPRIVHHRAAPDEARTEHAIVAFLQLAIVLDQIFRAVRTVRHDDRHGVSGNARQTVPDRHAKAVTSRIGDRHYLRMTGAEGVQPVGGGVRTAVVHHHDLEVADVRRKNIRKPLQGLDNAALFVAGRHYERQLHRGTVLRDNNIRRVGARQTTQWLVHRSPLAALHCELQLSPREGRGRRDAGD